MRLGRTPLAVVAALVSAGLAAAPGTDDAAAVAADGRAPVQLRGPGAGAPGCTSVVGVLSQTADGRVVACLRLGDISAGPHTISLRDLLEFGPPPRRFLPPGDKQRAKPTPPPSEPAVTLSLSPAVGGPGTVVTVTGRLRKPFHPRDSHPNLCWDGCQNGLLYGDPPVLWTSSHTFRTWMIVPAAPWIEGGPPRVAPLVSGDYAIAIQCVRSARGCPAVTEGTAAFRLRVTGPVVWCRTQAACGRLDVRPARALPGEVVRVTGFVPLAAGETPATALSPWEIAVTRRRAGEAEFRFTGHDGVRQASAGTGAIDVEMPPRYAGLRHLTPLTEVSDGVPQISADPADPSTVAWCAGTTIGVQGPLGTVYISTATAKATLQAMGFSFRFEPEVPCAAVAPLATASGSPAGLAAAFDVTSAAGAPPFYLAALVTLDNGQTWAPIPVPRGSGPAGFGGFRYDDAALEAVFAKRAPGGSKSYPAFSPVGALSEVTAADGHSWSPGSLRCPPEGPCLTFGPYTPGNCAMNGTTQLVLRSTDGGGRWSAPGFPYPVQSCDQATLRATSPSTELLVDSASTYPVLRTTDGGATWHDIAIPRPAVRGNITALPDGSLLATTAVGAQGRWRWLRRGARRWCTVSNPAGAVQGRYRLSQVTVISDSLWWLTGSPATSDAPPVLNQLPLEALSC